MFQPEEKDHDATAGAETSGNAASASDKSCYPKLRLSASQFKADLKLARPFMADEETRFYLCGVFFKYHNNQLTIAATNGHILFEKCFDVEVELSENYQDFDFILPAETVNNLINIIPNDKESFLTLQQIDEAKNVCFDFFQFEYQSKTIDGIYPDYQKMIPHGKIQASAGLNAMYFLKAVKALGNNPINLLKDSETADEPWLLTSDQSNGLRCVIMPLRTNW